MVVVSPETLPLDAALQEKVTPVVKLLIAACNETFKGTSEHVSGVGSTPTGSGVTVTVTVKGLPTQPNELVGVTV